MVTPELWRSSSGALQGSRHAAAPRCAEVKPNQQTLARNLLKLAFRLGQRKHDLASEAVGSEIQLRCAVQFGSGGALDQLQAQTLLGRRSDAGSLPLIPLEPEAAVRRLFDLPGDAQASLTSRQGAMFDRIGAELV